MQQHYEDVHADDGGGGGGDGGAAETGGSGRDDSSLQPTGSGSTAASPSPPNRRKDQSSALKATYEAALKDAEAATGLALESASAANARVAELEAKRKEEAWYSATLKDQLELEKVKVASLGMDGLGAGAGAGAAAAIEVTATLQAEVLQLKKDLDAAQAEVKESDARHAAADTELAAVAAKVSAQAQELLDRPQKEEVDALLAELNQLKSAGVDATKTAANEDEEEEEEGGGGGSGGGGGGDAFEPPSGAVGGVDGGVNVDRTAPPQRGPSASATVTLERKLSDSLVIVDAKAAEVQQWKSRYEAAVARAEKQEARATVAIASEPSAHAGVWERACAIKDGELAELRTSQISKAEELAKAEKGKAEAASKAASLGDAVKELKELIELNKEEKGKLRAELREGHKLEAEISNELSKREAAASAVEAALEKAEIKLAEQCAAFDTKIEMISAEKRQLRERVSAMEMTMIENSEQMAMMMEGESAQVETAQEVSMLLAKADLLEQTNVSFEAQVAELDLENKTLKKECTAGKADRAQLAKSLAVAEASVAELEQAKVNIENDMGAMAQKTRQSQKDSKALAQLVEQSKLLFVKQKVQLQGQLAATKAELGETRAELANAQQDRAEAKTSGAADITAFKDRAEAALTEKRTVERTLADTRKQLTEEIQQLHSDLGSIQQQLSDSEVKVRSLTATVDSITVEKQLAEGSVRDADAEKGGLLERVVAEEKKYSSLAAKLNTVVQDLKERTSAMEELAEENQELVKKINEVSSRQWESSSGVKQCKGCNSNFTVKRRKHHCRNCGQIFCSACTPNSAKTTTSKKAVRVCQPCFTELQ